MAIRICLRTAAAAALTVAALLTGHSAALAQAYPSKPITLIVPWPAGGASDRHMRTVAEIASTHLGQPIVVENRPGGGGTNAPGQMALLAKPDGYTVAQYPLGMLRVPHMQKVPWHPINDFSFIAGVSGYTFGVVVKADSPYKTFEDFLADAKARPGQISYASAGPGSSIHMITALFELSSGTRLLHVPYKGSGPAMIDLLAGQVQVMFENMSSGMPHVQGGKVRVLAVTGAQRDPRFPNVPTVAESGVPGFSGTSWFTVAAPASTPPELIQRLNQDVQRVLAAPDVRERFDKLGLTYTPNTPAQAQAFIRSETQKWNRVIEAAQLQLD